MKTVNTIITTLMVSAFTLTGVNAQNYKAPSIDATGKVMDAQGKHIGWVTTDGLIKDASGKKMGQVNSEGTLVDANGKKLGKTEKNGNFTSHFAKTKDDQWTASEPMNGMCEVKDKDGKTMVVVHENYKQYGACAYHCLSMKKDHKEMKMK
ncbi:MAG: DUF3659 domain-containing protein [Opitutaceae bacterium]|nr:DUF3659 domain-containing protein [Cytophagales bacterium]